MPDPQFKPGDTARPKSGGPLMTITEVGRDHANGTPVVWTVWFDKDQKEQKGYYPAAVLSPDDGSPVIA
jgi:uncharacterized protein YodC (DUF2158 family)